MRRRRRRPLPALPHTSRLDKLLQPVALASTSPPRSGAAEGAPKPSPPRTKPFPTFPRGVASLGLPTLKFSPVSREAYTRTFDTLKAAKRAAAQRAEGGTVPAAGIPFSRSGRGRSVSHVRNCTCATCRSTARVPDAKAAPVRVYYRMKSSSVLVHTLLREHGLQPATKSSGWTVFWTGTHLKSYVFQGLNKYQRINQFPRSFELTRKDTLARNMTRMQQVHGERHFQFLPKSFVLPHDAAEFEATIRSMRGMPWIVKPAASAQGKGIYLTQFEEGVGVGDAVSVRDSSATVSMYIPNPLLLDGYKFDLRLYVAVTSMNPLRIYLHEEGLCRFATVPYDPDPSHYSNRFMHLTNYSINKKSRKFVPGGDDGASGHKWSLPALKKRLADDGVDVPRLWAAIHDLLIKTFIAIEGQVNAAMDMFVPHAANCFELFGFDVLIDDTLQPWLIEVNFAPSLACDADLDLRIKGRVVSDILNLAAVKPFDAKREEGVARAKRLARMGHHVQPPAPMAKADMLLSMAPLSASLRSLPHRKSATAPPGGASPAEDASDDDEYEDDFEEEGGEEGVEGDADSGTPTKATPTEEATPGGEATPVEGAATSVDATDMVVAEERDGGALGAGDAGPGDSEAPAADVVAGAGAPLTPPLVTALIMPARPKLPPVVVRSSAPTAASTPKSAPEDPTSTSPPPTPDEPDVDRLSAARKRYLAGLSPADARIVRDTSAELKRAGDFVRIFPNGEAHAYSPFFTTPRPANQLLAEYEYSMALEAMAGGGPEEAPSLPVPAAEPARPKVSVFTGGGAAPRLGKARRQRLKQSASGSQLRGSGGGCPPFTNF